MLSSQAVDHAEVIQRRRPSTVQELTIEPANRYHEFDDISEINLDLVSVSSQERPHVKQASAELNELEVKLDIERQAKEFLRLECDEIRAQMASLQDINNINLQTIQVRDSHIQSLNQQINQQQGQTNESIDGNILKFYENEIKLLTQQILQEKELFQAQGAEMTRIRQNLDGAQSTSLTAGVIYKEFEAYKDQMKAKIGNLEHRIKGEAAKDTQIAVLELEKSNMETRSEFLKQRMAEMELKLKSSPSDYVPAQLGKNPTTPVDASQQLEPGYVHRAKSIFSASQEAPAKMMPRSRQPSGNHIITDKPKVNTNLPSSEIGSSVAVSFLKANSDESEKKLLSVISQLGEVQAERDSLKNLYDSAILALEESGHSYATSQTEVEMLSMELTFSKQLTENFEITISNQQSQIRDLVSYVSEHDTLKRDNQQKNEHITRLQNRVEDLSHMTEIQQQNQQLSALLENSTKRLLAVESELASVSKTFELQEAESKTLKAQAEVIFNQKAKIQILQDSLKADRKILDDNAASQVERLVAQIEVLQKEMHNYQALNNSLISELAQKATIIQEMDAAKEINFSGAADSESQIRELKELLGKQESLVGELQGYAAMSIEKDMEIALLQKDIGSALAKYQLSVKDIEEKDTLLCDLRNEISENEIRHEQTVKNTQEETASLHRELSSRLEDYQAEIETKERTIGEQQQLLHQNDKHLQHLTSETQRSIDLKIELEQTIGALRNNLQAAKQQISDFDCKISDFEAQKASELGAMTNLNDALTESLNQQLNELGAKITRLSGELSHRDNDCLELEIERKRLVEAHDKAESAIQLKKAALKLAENSICTLKDQINELKNANTHELGEMNRMAGETSEVRSKHIADTKQIEVLNSSLSEIKAELATKMATISDDRSVIAKLNATISVKNEIISDSKRNIMELETDLRLAREKRDELEKELHTAWFDNGKLKSQAEVSAKNQLNLIKQIDEIKRASEARALDLKTSLEQHGIKILHLEKTYSEASSSLVASLAAYAELESSLTKLAAEQAVKDNHALKLEIESYSQTEKLLEANRLSGELIIQKDQIVKSLTADILQLQKADSKTGIIIKQLQFEINTLNTQNSELGNIIADKVSIHNTLNNNWLKLKEDSRAMETILSEKEKHIHDIQQDLESARTAVFDSENSVRRLSSIVESKKDLIYAESDMTKILNEKQSLELKLAIALKSLDESLQQQELYDAQISEFKLTIIEAENSKNTLLKRISDQEKQLDGSLIALKILEDEKSQILSTLTEDQQMQQKLTKNLEETIKLLNTEKCELVSEHSTLLRGHQEIAASLLARESQFADAQADILALKMENFSIVTKFTAQVTSLNDRVMKKDVEIAGIMETIAELNAEHSLQVSVLNTHINATNAEKVVILQSKDSADEDLASLNLDYNAAIKSGQTMQLKIQSMKNENIVLVSSLEAQVEENKTIEANVTRVKQTFDEQLTLKAAKITSLEKELDLFQSQLRIRSQNIDEKDRELVTLKLQIEDLKDSMTMSNKEHDSSTNAYNAQLRDLKKEYDALRSSSSMSSKELVERKAHIESQETLLRQSKDTIDSLQAVITEKVQFLKEASAIVEELKLKLSESKEKEGLQRKELTQLKSAADDLRFENSDHIHELANQKQRVEMQNKILREKEAARISAENQVINLQQDYSSIKETYDILKAAFDENSTKNTQALASKTKEIVRLASELTSSKLILTENDSQSERLSIDVSNLKQMVTVANAKADMYRADIEDMKQRARHSEEKLSRMADEYLTTSQEMQERWNADIQRHESTNAAYTHEISILKGEIENAKSSLELSRAEVKNWAAASEKQTKEHSVAVQRIAGEKMAILEDLKAASESIVAFKKEINSNIETHNDTLNDLIKSHDSTLAENLQAIKGLSDKLDSKNSELLRLTNADWELQYVQSDLVETKHQRQKSDNMVKNSGREIEDLKRQIILLQGSMSQFKAMQESRSKMTEDIRMNSEKIKNQSTEICSLEKNIEEQDCIILKKEGELRSQEQFAANIQLELKTQLELNEVMSNSHEMDLESHINIRKELEFSQDLVIAISAEVAGLKKHRDSLYIQVKMLIAKNEASVVIQSDLEKDLAALQIDLLLKSEMTRDFETQIIDKKLQISALTQGLAERNDMSMKQLEAYALTANENLDRETARLNGLLDSTIMQNERNIESQVDMN